MSELGQHGAYLSARAKNTVRQVARLYAAALDAAWSEQVLSHEEQAKKEVELLLDVAVEIAVINDISFADVVYNFVSTWITRSKENEETPF